MLLAFPRMLRELFYSQSFTPRGGRANVPALVLVGVLNFGVLAVATFAAPAVEFDIARTVECRDITPRERLAQYPAQRLIEVTHLEGRPCISHYDKKEELRCSSFFG